MFYLGQIGYYELNIDYIIETYCVNKDKPQLQCNGKCHLAKQMQLTSTSSEDNTDATFLAEAFFPVFLVQQSEVIFKNNHLDLQKKSKFHYNKQYTHLVEHSIYKPPMA
ncbi:hypothetical protein [Mangrovimonas sp. YM274]|uniref:hypothetical protein n=1 Tax=Mangrovimonas sp. YM274 TaxID=3070660 RepID=UPI0027DE577D|nr:hypothetical protein [Mangrovimonas sp. YM274]WMI67715.1 hypothetical protein RBH95_11245 [Mangrovimonas sp. YM274]